MLYKTLGFALTGSYCTIERTLPEIENLVLSGATVTPILSENFATVDTRFGSAADWIEKIEQICGRRSIRTIVEAEPIGPKKMFDALIIAPCTSNTLAKIANGITDGPVTMACKAHLRSARPVVLAISTNDALSGSARNIGQLLNTKHFYFVPFGQDDVAKKPNSLVSHTELILPTVEAALEGHQLQPLLAPYA